MKVLPNTWSKLIALAVVLVSVAACDSSEDEGQCDVPFTVVDLAEGDGEVASVGRLAEVEYTGYLCDESMPDLKGDQFQSAVYTFVVGAGDVIAGWDQGIVGMKVGGRRRLTIPPDMAYGQQGSADVIPPNATLVFDVELLSVN